MPVGQKLMTGAATFRDGGFRIDNRDEIPHVISALQRMGEPASCRVPLLQGLYRGDIAYLDVTPATSNRLIKTFLASVAKPTIVVIADDGDNPVGLSGFASIERLMRWARGVIIHGTGAELWQYETFVLIARTQKRLVLIECPSRLVEPYRAATLQWARHAFVRIIAPPPGEFHPDPGAPRSIQ